MIWMDIKNRINGLRIWTTKGRRILPLTAIIVGLDIIALNVFGAYTNALYNSCFQSIYNFGLCPLNAVVYLPYILEFCAFLIVNRKTNPPSYALSFLAAAIISYVFFGLVVAAGATGNSMFNLALTTATLLTVCWIAAFAFEIFK
jgi:hypothetical protein